jgi:hypothetical protein
MHYAGKMGGKESGRLRLREWSFLKINDRNA